MCLLLDAYCASMIIFSMLQSWKRILYFLNILLFCDGYILSHYYVYLKHIFLYSIHIRMASVSNIIDCSVDYVHHRRNHINLCQCILTVLSLDIITNLFDFEVSRAYNQSTFSPWTHYSTSYIFLKTHFFSRRCLILINVTSLRSNHKRVARLNFIGQ